MDTAFKYRLDSVNHTSYLTNIQLMQKYERMVVTVLYIKVSNVYHIKQFVLIVDKQHQEETNIKLGLLLQNECPPYLTSAATFPYNNKHSL